MISNPLGIIPEPLSTNLASDESVFAFDKNDLPSLVIKEGAEEYIIDDDKSLFVGLLKEYTCSTDLLRRKKKTREEEEEEDWVFVEEEDSQSQKKQTIELSLTGDSSPSSAESYTLQIDSTAILLRAKTKIGLIHGIHTLLQIIHGLEEGSSSVMQIPCLFIKDEPRFGCRGCLLDCARHFMDIEFILKFVRVLAYHKMNRLHWHLVDDQGWRIKIDRYPALTTISSQRTNADGSIYKGFYTKEEIKQVVALATSLGIEVVPEIELPGHCVCVLAAYPQLGCTRGPYTVPCEWGIFEDVYCVGRESTFEFLEAVLDEVIPLFPSKYIHIGGDEVPKTRWEKCTDCQSRLKSQGLDNCDSLQSYFVNRISKFITEKRGKIVLGWDEILEGGALPKGAIVQSWRGTAGGIEAVRSGHAAIISPTSHCYFDYPISKIDLAKVYTFEPIPEEIWGDTEKEALILGGECCMWSERAPQPTVFGKVYPRMLALVTKLWCARGIESRTPFEEFRRSMIDVHFKRLAKLGVDGVEDGMSA